MYYSGLLYARAVFHWHGASIVEELFPRGILTRPYRILSALQSVLVNEGPVVGLRLLM